MEEDAGEEQIPVQVRVDSAKRGCGAHHLRGMPEQSSPVRMMVETRGSGSLKPLAVLGQENAAERLQPGVCHRIGDFLQVSEIPFHCRRSLRSSCKEFLRFLRRELTHPPAPAIKAEGPVDQEFALDLDAGAAVGLLARIKSRCVRPGAQRQSIRGIPQLELPEWFAVCGFLFVDLVNLPADPAGKRAGPAVLSELGNRAMGHRWHGAKNGDL